MISHSSKETIEYAQRFAHKLHGGEVIGLTGDLGGGKTTFVKGLARGLGIKANITSPTFVILKEYDILKPQTNLRGLSKRLKKLIHIDAYRLENISDIKSIGIEDYLGCKDNIIVIEWAEKIKNLPAGRQEILPKSTIYIKFDFINENTRKITKLKITRSQ